MVDERMDALAARQHGLITHEQALAVGFTEAAIRHRRRTGLLSAACPRVYRMRGATEGPRLRALAAVLGAGADAVLSHRSAAGLHGLPGFTIEPLTVSMPRRRRALPGVRLEQTLVLARHHSHLVDGIPCTSVARTMFDLCGDVRPRRAERALDTALARRMVTLPALWRILDDLAEHGRAGTVCLRTLLMERGPRYVAPESELEARFIKLIRDFRLAVPERQVDLGDGDSWIGRVDFVFRSARLVVEVDGAEFHDALVDHRRDVARDERLTAAGWTVMRPRWDDIVNRPATVAAEIRHHLAGSQPPPSSFRGASASL